MTVDKTATTLLEENGVQMLGNEMNQLIGRLYPICRSITGNGVRETLKIISEKIPLTVYEVPSGTQVFDWTVPKEWNIRDAFIKNAAGERVVDFRRHNLHVVNYSVPVQQKMNLAQLRPHLHSLPEHPSWIPYRTSYYSENWGFCLADEQLRAMPDGEYEVCIDSTLEPGHLTYGEYFLPGESEDEILFYSHVCHPALCNDNLSGIALLTYLAQVLTEKTRRWSYRFVFGPGTIGSITWLAQNESRLHKIKHGLVVALVGDPGPLNYKKTRLGSAYIDRAVQCALRDSTQPYNILEFSPYGYDERQFGSPGINLPIGRLTRTPNGEYEEYHSSADNLTLISPKQLSDSLAVCLQVVDILEQDERYQSNSPKCEPQLGKRGLYRKSGGQKDLGQRELALLWVLNLADGTHSLLDMAVRSGLDFGVLQRAAQDLYDAELLRVV